MNRLRRQMRRFPMPDFYKAGRSLTNPLGRRREVAGGLNDGGLKAGQAGDDGDKTAGDLRKLLIRQLMQLPAHGFIFLGYIHSEN